jgi:agmatine deiminase
MKISLFYFGLFCSGFFLLTACNENKPKQEVEKKIEQQVVRQAAEYDPQDALWLIWNPLDHLEGYSNAGVTKQIVESVIPFQKVVVSVADSTIYEQAKSILSKEVLSNKNLEFVIVPSIQFWTRDMGPVFVELNTGEKAVADFNFNSWGYAEVNDPDNQVEEAFDENVGKLLNYPIISSDMISEGGNREVNGEGTLLVVEKVEQGRNPEMTKEQMEAEYKRLLGVTNIVWLKTGLREDDHTFLGPIETADGTKAYTVVTTNGHIDEFARFVNDSTIILAKVDEEELRAKDPIAIENNKRLEENFAILQNAKDSNGNSFHIIRFPMPQIILKKMKPGDEVYEYIKTLDFQDGSVFPTDKTIDVIAAASYLNFTITNNVVLAQKYYQEDDDKKILERDTQVKNLLQELFPAKEIIMIDAMAVNLGGGGIHCITMHEPILTK